MFWGKMSDTPARLWGGDFVLKIKYIFGYFDPDNILLDYENKYLLG